MADDRLSAALEEIRERDQRVWNGRGNVGGLLAITEAKDDVPRLLAAVDAVLKMADRALVTMREPDGKPWLWDLRPDEIREAITRELSGEEHVCFCSCARCGPMNAHDCGKAACHRRDAEPEPFKRPEGCICIMFRDTGGFRIADLTCPVHGAGGTDPGDGYWEEADDATR